jgi:hypothetical protein
MIFVKLEYLEYIEEKPWKSRSWFPREKPLTLCNIKNYDKIAAKLTLQKLTS